MDQEVTIEGKKFTLVKLQREGLGVYRSGDLYLRLGRPEAIQKDLTLHKEMIGHGFPVAEVVSNGQHNDSAYFIEHSLGENHFGRMFAEDIKKTGNIADTTFQAFLDITTKFAEAQLTTATQTRSSEEFANGIHLSLLFEELPKETEHFQERFNQAFKRVSVFPFVVTHGDLNPHNLFSEGVIDLESSFMGPAGYDLVTNIIHINHFPASTEYEYYQEYTFNPDHKQQYFQTIDTIYQQHGLPQLSPFAIDFEFCRAVWAAVRIHKYPKLQEFRYNQLRQY